MGKQSTLGSQSKVIAPLPGTKIFVAFSNSMPRDHLKSTLLLEFQIANKLFLTSPIFVLRARKKGLYMLLCAISVVDSFFDLFVKK